MTKIKTKTDLAKRLLKDFKNGKYLSFDDISPELIKWIHTDIDKVIDEDENINKLIMADCGPGGYTCWFRKLTIDEIVVTIEYATPGSEIDYEELDYLKCCKVNKCACVEKKFHCPFCKNVFVSSIKNTTCILHAGLEALTEIRCTICNR